MSVKEAVLAALQELVLPELALIKQEQAGAKIALALTHKRLDDLNAHLVDQSRRIDETNKRLDELSTRFDHRQDETNLSMGRLYEVIVRREEHQDLSVRVSRLEQEVAELRRRQRQAAAP